MYKYRIMFIIMYSVVAKNNINVEFSTPTMCVITIAVIAINTMPNITDKNELVLCFITSASFSASSFGYFRLIIIPIKCDTKGINIDSIINNSISIILVLILINNIISPINKIGVVRIKLEYIFDINIVFVFIGSDLRILMFLPSKLITELVIDVINAVTVISANINIDELLSIILLDIPIVFGSVSSDTILSYLIAITIVAITNSTNANPELIINTGVSKNVFNSFFISDLVFDF